MATSLRYGTWEEAGMDPARIRRAAGLAQQWVTEGHTSGVVVLAVRRGVVVLHEAFGRLTPESDAPILPRDALYPIASVVKPMYATAVLCLVEDGRLGLNRPVQEYLPEFVGTGKEQVLVRHLLTHTAGLDDEATRRYVAQRTEASGSGTATAPRSTARENSLLSLEAPLVTPPGIAMLYSTIGYEFLGEIVRRVSEQSLAQFMAERLWGPLAMADTSFGVPQGKRHRIARRRPPETTTTGYGANLESPIAIETVGDGGQPFSTAWDLAVFGQLFLQRGTYGDRRILSPASVVAMTRNQVPGIAQQFEDERFPEASWGLGWSVHGPKQPRRAGALYSEAAFEHPGNGGTYLWVDPVYEVVGIYLSLLVQGAPGLNPGWHADLFSNVVTAAVDDG